MYTHSELHMHIHSFQLSSYISQGTKDGDAAEDDYSSTGTASRAMPDEGLHKISR
jgi:hypothetical protein